MYLKQKTISLWNNEETGLLETLDTPSRIQDFLDSLDYNPDYECRSPRWVIKRRKAHCFEGALFAASALRYIGYKPLLVDLKAYNDDDHVIAVFKINGYWGAVAKSNFTTLRFREPVYRTLRELVMSYFDFYFNTKGEKTLRSYSRPLNLTAFDNRQWETTDEDLEYIGDRLEKIVHYQILTIEMIERLSLVSEPVMKAGLLGAKEEGLFRPV